MYKSKEEAVKALNDANKIIEEAKNYIENNSSDKLLKMEKRFLELINGLKYEYYEGGVIARNVKGEYIFGHNSKAKMVWLSYDRIWSVFKSEFNLNYDEIKKFTTGMVEKYMNCNSFTTDYF